MRRPAFRSVPRYLRQQPRVALALGAVMTLVALGILAAILHMAPTPSTPAFSYAQTWSLSGLQDHLEAGDVVAITTSPDAAPGGTADASLLARTRAGELVRIRLDVTPGAASAAPGPRPW